RIAGRAVKAGDPAQGQVWLFEDITHAHEADERVRRAAAEQELILDNASVGIAFVRNRAIQRCNRFLEDMVGAGPGELVGESSACSKPWAPSGARWPSAPPSWRMRKAAPSTSPAMMRSPGFPTAGCWKTGSARRSP